MAICYSVISTKKKRALQMPTPPHHTTFLLQPHHIHGQFQDQMAPHHFITPKKARIQGACDFLDAKGIEYSHMDVFRFQHGAGKSAGWKALREPRILDGRSFHSSHAKTRRRKKKLSREDLATIERFIESEDLTREQSLGLAFQPLPALILTVLERQYELLSKT